MKDLKEIGFYTLLEKLKWDYNYDAFITLLNKKTKTGEEIYELINSIFWVYAVKYGSGICVPTDKCDYEEVRKRLLTERWSSLSEKTSEKP